MQTTPDYSERVYAGVLGKVIGVYTGKPFEGWTHEAIMEELGEIKGYVHSSAKLKVILSPACPKAYMLSLARLDYSCTSLTNCQRNLTVYGSRKFEQEL